MRAAPLVFLAVASSLVAGCGGVARSSHGGVARSAHGGATASTGSPVARGAALYQDDGCSGCHSLNGTRLVGPSWKGLAGSRVTLTSGRTVIADDAYLIRHIVEPNALTVRGYPRGVMAQAIEALGLKDRPDDVRALVAFIDSLK